MGCSPPEARTVRPASQKAAKRRTTPASRGVFWHHGPRFGTTRLLTLEGCRRIQLGDSALILSSPCSLLKLFLARSQTLKAGRSFQGPCPPLPIPNALSTTGPIVWIGQEGEAGQRPGEACEEVFSVLRKGTYGLEERRRDKDEWFDVAVGGTALTKNNRTFVSRAQDSRRRTSRLCSRGLVQTRANACLHLP